MILRMYSVYDIKSKIYHPPQFCHNAGHALRMFQSQFSKSGSLMNEFPQDFQIFELGAYDDSNGSIEGLQNPTCICTVADLVSKIKEDQNGTNNPDPE